MTTRWPIGPHVGGPCSKNYIDQMITLGYHGAFLDVVAEAETRVG